jgi:hypothetical protein
VCSSLWSSTWGGVEAGAQVKGISIDKLDLGALGDEVSFDRTLREPLNKLYQSGYSEPIVLLVDSLDEAMIYTGAINIAQLLAKLGDLPEQVRFLATSRGDPGVLYLLPSARKCDLIDNAPEDADDVRSYASERLRALPEPKRSELARRLSDAANGIFLYAHLILNDLVPQLSASPDPSNIQFPAGLTGLYQESLNRQFGGANRPRWFKSGKPVLELMAVAQGEGLSKTQIERVTGQDPEEALETLKQYLDGELPEGPFRPFHKSFADFLFADENQAYRIDAGKVHRQIADFYLPEGRQPVFSQWDEYGLSYVATHLAEAARRSEGMVRHELIEWLAKLVVNREFQNAHLERVNDLDALERDIERALHSAARDSRIQAPSLSTEIAFALTACRREQLKHQPLFDLARAGEVEAAVRRLDLLKVEPDWHQATLLTIALLASAVSPDKARAVRDRIKSALPAYGPLPMLLSYLKAALDGTPTPFFSLPSAPPPQVVRELVARMGGTTADTELIAILPDEPVSGAGYFAQHDAPFLVAFAVADPVAGNRLFEEYLSLHTGYSYAYYRNRSLWFLLEAVLRYPDLNWVREKTAQLTKAALAGSRLEFQEALPLTLVALQAATGKPDAQHSLSSDATKPLPRPTSREPKVGRVTPGDIIDDDWLHWRKAALDCSGGRMKRSPYSIRHQSFPPALPGSRRRHV